MLRFPRQRESARAAPVEGRHRLMNQETFGLIVGLATIGAFLLELAKVLYAVCKKLSSRRMARKGEKDTPINK